VFFRGKILSATKFFCLPGQQRPNSCTPNMAGKYVPDMCLIEERAGCWMLDMDGVGGRGFGISVFRGTG